MLIVVGREENQQVFPREVKKWNSCPVVIVCELRILNNWSMLDKKWKGGSHWAFLGEAKVRLPFGLVW